MKNIVFNYKHIKAMHILENNKLKYEYIGNYSEEELFSVGCIFKAFLSALVGIAIKQGKIISTDDKVTDYWLGAELSDSRWRYLTVGHVLSKTTGLCWPGPSERIPSDMAEVFKLQFSADPGAEFAYKPDPQIIVYLLERIYEKGIVEIMQENLICKLGNDKWNWNRNRIEDMQLPIKTLDRFGELYLQCGKIDEFIIFEQDYYADSIREYSNGGFPECLPYGYGWWVGTFNDVKYHMASGFGGQIVGVIPDRNTVVTILSEMDRPHPENKKIIEMIISEQYNA
ncbi:serine hydrolase domain-containing protein [Lacrimispora sp. 38-1]|uniref:serine hydrolase domain-containing protein n=1 Tax=Lacrimispora sp. 38-1 TaxID=3125778 RepID=UPI003CF0D8BC